MRNLDIADSRARLEQYAGMGLLGVAPGRLMGELTPGGAEQIASNRAYLEPDEDVESLDHAAIELGVD